MKDYMHFVKGIDPVADFMSGTVYTDVVSMRDHNVCTFLIYKGVGVTGTSVITVEACDDFTPTTTSAITFNYQAITSGDTHGTFTAAATTGFTLTAGSSQLYAIYVDASKLAATGYPNVRLAAVESVNSAVLGGIAIILSEPKDGKAVTRSAIA